MSGAEVGHHTTPTVPSEATLQGLTAQLADDASRLDIFEKAFDFRGDCTLTLRDGRTITGYIFDRRHQKAVADSFIRLMTATSDDKVRINYSDVVSINFGKDTAHGKSFDTWVKKYTEKKLKGEAANIESEAL
jgi:hypothetical protein